MATRKRTSRRSGLVGRAVSAGRRALREAEKRVPPDLRRQAERRIKDADKSARAAIKALQTQVNRASTRADVNSVLKRIDGMTKQARQVIRGTGTRAASSRRAASTARRTTTRTRTAASTTKKAAAGARRKPAATSRRSTTGTRRAASTTGRAASTTKKAASPRRTTSRRRRGAETAIPSMPLMPMTPMAPETGFIIETEEIEER
jgi:hypothetical protein